MTLQKTTLVIALLIPALASATITQSVVKIFTVYNEYDFYRPWQMKGKNSKTGSGCIIEGNRILTNAHVVADQTFIQVKRAGQPDKFVARVEFVAHECDLAILQVPDKSFFKGASPVPIGTLPQIRDNVAVYGFPRGGTKIAITEGVVSRIENLFYSHSQAYLLCCQIDAPINSGSSGGPVISNQNIVGVAFQAASGENIGYMVPAPVIQHFLDDVEDGSHDGFPSIGLQFQTLENPDLRKRLQMNENMSGVMVNQIFPLSPARNILDVDDVILGINKFDVANDATISFRDDDRTHFMYAFQKKQIDESVEMEILREGEKIKKEITLTIRSNEWQLVPRQLYDTMPRYFIGGGIVFVPLTRNFLTTWGSQWMHKAPKNLVYHYFQNPDSTRDEVVVIGQILTDELNVGYDNLLFSVVDTVNGEHIQDLEQVVRAFETNENAWHEIVDSDGFRLVMSVEESKERKATIFKRYKIVFDRSPDLKR